MKLNEYLATHSRKRNTDKVIIEWMRKKEPISKDRKKEEWDVIVSGFFGETGTKKFNIPIEVLEKRKSNKK
jgi:hypothetical protein